MAGRQYARAGDHFLCCTATYIQHNFSEKKKKTQSWQHKLPTLVLDCMKRGKIRLVLITLLTDEVSSTKAHKNNNTATQRSSVIAILVA